MDRKSTLALWKKMSSCIADEIVMNEDFAKRMGELLGGNSVMTRAKKPNRRSPAKVDPFAMLERGVNTLTDALQNLSVEELKDVIAANGMDTARLAMKWKDRERLVNHIVEMTQRRASRGDAFWNASGKPLDTE